MSAKTSDITAASDMRRADNPLDPVLNPVYNRGRLVGVLREVSEGRVVFDPIGDRCPSCGGPGELVRMRPNMLIRHANAQERHACRVASWRPGRPL